MSRLGSKDDEGKTKKGFSLPSNGEHKSNNTAYRVTDLLATPLLLKK